MRRDRRGHRHISFAWQSVALASAASFAMVTALSGATASAANATGPVPNTAAGFNTLLDRGDLIFDHYDGHHSSAAFKAVYKVGASATVASNGGDCSESSKTITIEENSSDTLTYFPKCAEAISTPSTLYVCEWAKAVQCHHGKGNYFSNPFLSWEQQNLSPSSILSTFESGSGEPSPHGTYSRTTVAGQNTECMTASYFRLCVTDAGLLALTQLTGSAASGAGGSLALTFYRPSAPDSDFRPPATASMKAGPA